MLARIASCLSLAAAAVAQEPADSQLPPAPTAATLAAWLEHILPTAAESAWESIPWLPTFADGMRTAQLQNKPLLVWVMNGHPLGCT